MFGRVVKIAVFLTVGLVVYFILGDLFFRIISLCSVLMIFGSAVVMILTFRKARRISPRALAVSAGSSFVIMFIYLALMGIRVALPGIIILMGIGAAAGILWGRTMQVTFTNGAVSGRGNLWYLMVWGSIFALTHLTAISTGRPPAVVSALLLIGTGMVLGNSFMLFRKYKAAILTGSR